MGGVKKPGAPVPGALVPGAARVPGEEKVSEPHPGVKKCPLCTFNNEHTSDNCTMCLITPLAEVPITQLASAKAPRAEGEKATDIPVSPSKQTPGKDKHQSIMDKVKNRAGLAPGAPGAGSPRPSPEGAVHRETEEKRQGETPGQGEAPAEVNPQRPQVPAPGALVPGAPARVPGEEKAEPEIRITLDDPRDSYSSCRVEGANAEGSDATNGVYGFVDNGISPPRVWRPKRGDWSRLCCGRPWYLSDTASYIITTWKVEVGGSKTARI